MNIGKKRIKLNNEKRKTKAKQVTDPIDSEQDAETADDDNWKVELIDQLNAFTPSKFESFSRLLISKMGVRIDDKLGKIQSRDHGIDGFGYFESDEFRTARVAIQSKKSLLIIPSQNLILTNLRALWMDLTQNTASLLRQVTLLIMPKRRLFKALSQ